MSFTAGHRLAAQAAIRLKQELQVIKKDDLIPLFHKLDEDKDGKLTISEMVSSVGLFGFDRQVNALPPAQFRQHTLGCIVSLQLQGSISGESDNVRGLFHDADSQCIHLLTPVLHPQPSTTLTRCAFTFLHPQASTTLTATFHNADSLCIHQACSLVGGATGGAAIHV